MRRNRGDEDGVGLGRVARGGAVNMAGAVVGAGLNLGVVVAVARGFSPEAAGVFFSATSVFLIMAAVANLGTSNGLVYFVARLRALGAAGQVPSVLRLAFGPTVAVAAVLAVATLLLADPLARWLGAPEAGTYLRLLAAFLPFAVAGDAAMAAARGMHDMGSTVAFDKVARPLSQLVLLGTAALVGAAGLLTVAWAGPYLPIAALAWWWLRRLLRRADDDGATASEAAVAPGARTFWAFTLPRSVADIAQIGIQRSGIVLVAVLRSAAEAALFTAATRFMVVGQFGMQAVQYAAQPRMTELLALEDRAGANTLFQTSTAWLICLTWPLFLPLIVYAPLVLGVFGTGYAAGEGVLVVISLAMLLASACGMGDLVLTVAGRPRWSLVNNVAALVVDVCVCVGLVPMLGAVGAAVAWLAAIGVRNLLPVVQLARWLRLWPVGRPWLLAVAVTTVWFGLVPLGGRLLLGVTLPSLAATLAVAGLGYVATVWGVRGPLGIGEITGGDRRSKPASDTTPADGAPTQAACPEQVQPTQEGTHPPKAPHTSDYSHKVSTNAR
ncbi:lipopolysaccharide biosynthesis protein [Salinactinospora qingdaonensis]|uniref:Membrane protein involved in the export of O-antigen and teichoic acid n=1 Tax=Salinactinospora qingdaonensis TaxID=702744 RepID=A0ABP7FLM9_9ACTN